MRVALCVVATLLGSASFGYAQDSNINPRWKKVEIPTIDPNAGFTGRVSADQSNIWQAPDPSSLGQSRRSWNDEPSFGLTFSRPIQY